VRAKKLFFILFFSLSAGAPVSCSLGVGLLAKEDTQTILQHFGGPLEQAMGLSEWALQRAFTRDDWQIVRAQYNWHIVGNLDWAEEPRIPKIIHHIWLGSPFPEKYEQLRETWKQHHPDWEFILWTDEDVAALGLENQTQYDETPNYGVKSDIVRYEILYRFGGLYVDTDFECVQPFDVFHHCCDFYSGAAACEWVVIYNGLIACAPGHPVLRFCIDNICSSGGKQETGKDIDMRTGPHFFTNCFFSALHECDGPSVIFPAAYFYPWPHYHRDKNSREEILAWLCPETFGIHHWHVSWMKGN